MVIVRFSLKPSSKPSLLMPCLASRSLPPSTEGSSACVLDFGVGLNPMSKKFIGKAENFLLNLNIREGWASETLSSLTKIFLPNKFAGLSQTSNPLFLRSSRRVISNIGKFWMPISILTSHTSGAPLYGVKIFSLKSNMKS